MSSPATTRVREDAELVRAALGTERQAYGELFQRWYDRCYDVAWNICRNRETAADIAQDAFLVCWERLSELRDHAAFGGWILRVTRNRALNRLERDRARTLEPIETEEPVSMSDPDADPAIHAERDDRQQLVWTAAAALGERDTSLLDLHLRHGLEPAEIAQELQITPNNAHQLLYRLRAKLRDTIGAALLWRQGRPTCEHLAGLVPTGGGFDAKTARIIRKHQRGCSICSGEMSRQTNPERLFTAVPLAAAPLALKERAFAELVRAGVPLLPPTGGQTLAATGHPQSVESFGGASPAPVGAVPGHAGASGVTRSFSRHGSAPSGAHRLDPTSWPRWMIAAGSVAVLVLGALVVIHSLPGESGGDANTNTENRAPIVALPGEEAPSGAAPTDLPGASGAAPTGSGGQDSGGDSQHDGSGAGGPSSGGQDSGGSDGRGDPGNTSGPGDSDGPGGSDGPDDSGGPDGSGGSDDSDDSDGPGDSDDSDGPGDSDDSDPGSGSGDEPDPGGSPDDPGTTPTNRIPVTQPTGILPVAPVDPSVPSASSGRSPVPTAEPTGGVPSTPVLPNPGPRRPGCWMIAGGWFGWWIWWPYPCHFPGDTGHSPTPSSSEEPSPDGTSASPTSQPSPTVEPVRKTPLPSETSSRIPTPSVTSVASPTPSSSPSKFHDQQRGRDHHQHYWRWPQGGQPNHHQWYQYHDWCSGNAEPGRGASCNGGESSFR
jgi:RNA polymerase sigma factor (sigma-70 family)